MLLASLACSLSGAAPAREEETEQPTAETAGEETAPAVDSSALAGLNSYRMRMTVTWTPDSGAAEMWTMEQEHTREPQAQRWTMQSDDGESIEWVQIGEMTWMCSAGSCIQSQQSAEEAAASFGQGMLFDPGDFASGRDTRYVGRETVNNVSAQHYVLDLTAAEVGLLAQGQVSDVQADLWISDAAGLPAYVVRYTMSWKETRDNQQGRSELSYDTYDVNAPLTIAPPEGATDMPEDVPIYPNAANLFMMQDMISFSASDDVATVVQFYRSELAAQGWSSQSDDEFGGMVSQTWSKEGRSLNLMVSPQDEGGSSVIIVIE